MKKYVDNMIAIALFVPIFLLLFRTYTGLSSVSLNLFMTIIGAYAILKNAAAIRKNNLGVIMNDQA